jgi:predicted NodU family carbamoyl transferase
MSEFERAAVLSIDGFGDSASTMTERTVLHEQPANDEVLDLLRAAHQGMKDKK